MPDFNILLGYASLLLQFAIVIVGLLRWSAYTASKKGVVLMVGVSIIIQIIGRIFGQMFGSNLPLYHFHILIELAFLWWIFRPRLIPFVSLKVLLLLGALFVIFFAVSGFMLQPFSEFPAYARFAEGVLVSFLCISYYRYELHRVADHRLEQTFMFWFSTGLLLYFVSNMLIYLFGNVLLADTFAHLWDVIWSLHNLLNIMLYIVFIIALALKDKVIDNSSTTA